MNDAPDFLSAADRLVAEAQSLGAVFSHDGGWTMNDGKSPLPAALVDRLRVHRRAVAMIMKKDS
ncbi:MAG TPA: hypothetical protein HPQ04_04525 [Rhodospirillaceae bacterium]|nr:hypothetical protein [Rhodospirillaceae bacterium]